MLHKFLLIPLLLLVVTGCESKSQQTLNKQILRLNLADDPSSLDPRIVRSLKDLTLVKQLFEGLMRMDQAGVPQPAVAEHIVISEDLLIYTFHLKETYWNNHDPVTAYDFEYAWKKVLDPSFASDYAYMLYPIKNAQLAREGKCKLDAVGVIALDKSTLKVELEQPTPYFLELVAFPTYYPINSKLDMEQKKWALPPGKQFVCNGPFYLKEWSPQEEIILFKNPLYWDKLAVHLDQINFSVITDNNTESQLFEKNQLDWLGQPMSHNIGTEILSQIKEKGNINSFTVAGTFWLKFNTEKEPFCSEKLRKAFSYAINREEIITHILQGNQTAATGPLPPCMTENRTVYFVDHDVNAAQKLLEEALVESKWTRETLPCITLNYPPTERNSKIVQLLQQQWKEALGVSIELVAVENQLYRRNVRQGLYQMGTGDWIADFNDPLAFLELFKHRKEEASGNGMNDTGWHNETFTALLEKSLTETDRMKRQKLLQEAEEILVQEMPIAPIYHYSFDYIKQSYVKDVVLSPLGSADFKTALISKPKNFQQ